MIEQENLISDDDIKRYQHIKYPFNPDQFSNLVEISEEIILKNWYSNINNETNDFDLVLDRAMFFKKYGLTPMFLTDVTGSKILVTSHENYNKKLN